MTAHWCHVIDGRIVYGPAVLPEVHDNISNFHTLTDGELRAKGWLPYRFVENWKPGKVLDGGFIEITETEVVETQLVRDQTPEEREACKPRRVIDARGFYSRFTYETRLRMQASDDPVVRDLLMQIMISQEIDLDDAEIITAMGRLVELEILTRDEASVLLV